MSKSCEIDRQRIYLQTNKCEKGAINTQGGTRQSFIRGGSVSEVQPLPGLLYTIFWQRRDLFRQYTFYWQLVPLSHTLHPFHRCKRTVFKIWINPKTRMFSPLFLSHKMHILALLGLFTDRNDIFQLSKSRNLTLSFYQNPDWKKVPHSSGASQYRPL